jgi:hypothetical protein
MSVPWVSAAQRPQQPAQCLLRRGLASHRMRTRPIIHAEKLKSASRVRARAQARSVFRARHQLEGGGPPRFQFHLGEGWPPARPPEGGGVGAGPHDHNSGGIYSARWG